MPLLPTNCYLAGLVALLGMACTGCFGTHIGMWDEQAFKSTDSGPPQTVHVCVYLDQGVTKDEAMELMQTTIEEDNKYYNLNVVPEGFGQLERAGFFHDQILEQVTSIPLTGSCDRVFYFAHHNVGDYLYAAAPVITGVPLPEVLGEVDDTTMTHGFAFAENDGVNSLMMGGPSSVIRHEFYHLVGSCPHAWTMDQCYQRISSLKHMAPDQGDGFFPSMSEDAQHVFKTRGQVNFALGDATPNLNVAANQPYLLTRGAVRAATQAGAMAALPPPGPRLLPLPEETGRPRCLRPDLSKFCPRILDARSARESYGPGARTFD